MDERRAVGAGALVDDASETWPPPSNALVMALSFIGLSTSSSELSSRFRYCEGWLRWANLVDVLLPTGA
jgi:hypothetical protein